MGLAEDRGARDTRRTMARRPGSPLLFDLPVRPDFSAETRLARDGHAAICGIDEAGRGPLAGPVVAAAVILDPAAMPRGLDDSKRLDEAARETAFAAILTSARAIAFASASAETIDRTDIRAASLAAMARAATALSVRPDFALIDGRDVPSGLPCPGVALVKGDQRSLSVAAASIVAKVMRDRMMAALAPDRHGFAGHKGYGTAAHVAALAREGPVARIHRMSFAPLRP